jgi:hypothetical protein
MTIQDKKPQCAPDIAEALAASLKKRGSSAKARDIALDDTFPLDRISAKPPPILPQIDIGWHLPLP